MNETGGAVVMATGDGKKRNHDQVEASPSNNSPVSKVVREEDVETESMPSVPKSVDDLLAKQLEPLKLQILELGKQNAKLKAQVDTLNRESVSLTSRVDDLQRDNYYLQSSVGELVADLENQQQYSRGCSFRVHGINEKLRDNPKGEILLLANQLLDCQLHPWQISACHRLGSTNNRESRTIICQLIAKNLKEMIVEKAKEFRQRLRDNGLYLSEDLTPPRANLLKSAKGLTVQVMRDSGAFLGAWTDKGKVKVRCHGRRVMVIRDQNALIEAKLFSLEMKEKLMKKASKNPVEDKEDEDAAIADQTHPPQSQEPPRHIRFGPVSENSTSTPAVKTLRDKLDQNGRTLDTNYRFGGRPDEHNAVPPSDQEVAVVQAEMDIEFRSLPTPLVKVADLTQHPMTPGHPSSMGSYLEGVSRSNIPPLRVEEPQNDSPQHGKDDDDSDL